MTRNAITPSSAASARRNASRLGPRLPGLALVAGAVLLAACEENAPPAPPPPTYPTRYVLANGGDSSVVMGYRATLTDTLADTVLQHGALWVQPIAPGAIREDAGPACHLGCEVTLRVDLLWQERSFRVVHQLATPGDTVIRFEWPGDTVLADEVPYGGFGARRQGNTRR